MQNQSPNQATPIAIKRYTPAQRQVAVDHVVKLNRPRTTVAYELGVSYVTLNGWIKKSSDENKLSLEELNQKLEKATEVSDYWANVYDKLCELAFNDPHKAIEELRRRRDDYVAVQLESLNQERMILLEKQNASGNDHTLFQKIQHEVEQNFADTRNFIDLLSRPKGKTLNPFTPTPLTERKHKIDFGTRP
jgi:transposase-like protein